MFELGIRIRVLGARSVKIILVESLYILTPPVAPRNLYESAGQCFVEFKENFKIMCGSNI